MKSYNLPVTVFWWSYFHVSGVDMSWQFILTGGPYKMNFYFCWQCMSKYAKRLMYHQEKNNESFEWQRNTYVRF